MKFVEVDYRVITANNPIKIPFGIVLQDATGLFFSFDTSTKKLSEIKKINPNVDESTFLNLTNTFKDTYVAKGVVITSDEQGNEIRIPVTDPRFLDYLHRTFQNNYKYTEPAEIQGVDPKKTLEYLYKERVENFALA